MDGLKRIRSGMLAKLFEILSRVFERVAFIPVFAYLITPTAFQDWAVLTAIHATMILFDFGLRTHVGNHLRDLWVDGDREAQRSLFKGALQTYTLLALGLLAVGAAAVAGGFDRLFHFDQLSAAERPWAVYLAIVLGTIMVVRDGLMEVYRANDQFNRLASLSALLWISRMAVGIVAIAVTRSLFWSFFIYTAFTLLFAVATLVRDLPRRFGHLLAGFRAAPAVRRLSWRTSLHLTTAEAARLIALQGPTLLVNALVRDASVVLAFVINRNLVTVVREFGMQFALNFGIELGRAQAAGDTAAQRRLVLTAGIVMGGGLGAGFGALLVVADNVLRLMSRSDVFDLPMFLLFGIGGMLVGISHVLVSWLMYAHRSQLVFRLRGAHGLVVLVGCLALIPVWQGYGAAVTLGVADIAILTVAAVIATRREFEFPALATAGMTLATLSLATATTAFAAWLGEAGAACAGFHGKAGDAAAVAGAGAALLAASLPLLLLRRRIVSLLRRQIAARAG